MTRFALSAVATLTLFAALSGTVDAGVRLTKVLPNGGIAQKTIGLTPAGKPVVKKTVIAPNGASIQTKTVRGPYHTHTKTTMTAPNGASITVRSRN